MLCTPLLRRYAIVALSLTCFTASAMADCNGIRPMRADEFSPASAQALLEKMVQVCSSAAPERWTTLVTTNVQTLLVKMPEAQRKTTVAQYCSHTRQAVAAMGGQASYGVHTLEIDARTTECGQKTSTWYVHSATGTRVLRLQVAKEDGLMKINTH